VGEHRVARVDDVPADRGLVVEAAGREIGLFRLGDEIFALRNRCPHQGGPVGTGGVFASVRGKVENRRLREFLDHDEMVVVCPWHGWEFDVRKGTCMADPTRRVMSYPTKVVDGEVIVVVGD
jgi:3-phenylpropionate/trans-cinnamate dioxygenase ferredoxin subunit